MMHWQGLTDLTGASYTPIALVNADPAGVQVARRFAVQDRQRSCSTAIKANPGKLKASGTGQGGIWHLAIAGLLQDLKIDPQTAIPWVPSNGAAPGLQDLVAGGVEIVPVLAARSARADRRRQGRRASRSWPTSRAALYPERADDEGSDGQQLDDGGVARHRGAEGPAAEASRQARRGDQEDRRSKEYTDFMAQQRLRRRSTRRPTTSPSSWPSRDADLGATMKAVGIVK